VASVNEELLLLLPRNIFFEDPKELNAMTVSSTNGSSWAALWMRLFQNGVKKVPDISPAISV
jgi:hypothetical protein